MYYLRVIKKDGNVLNFPIGDTYDIVFINAVDVMQKRAAFDVMKFIVQFNKESMSRNYILSPNLTAPLDCEGICFGGEVKEYKIFSSSACIRTIEPKNDFVSEDEAVEFWTNIERIPLQ